MAADLFTPQLQTPIAPDGRKEPRLWIRRLAIFKDPETTVRDVSLKPGLNIIWTPDMSSSGQPSLAHGSGKTTFCRLLRGCLGETDYASESQRNRIMTRFPEGFMAAEVLIDGVPWVIIRWFGIGSGDYAVQVDTIEDAIARRRLDGDPLTLDPIITQTFFSELLGRSPSEIGDNQVWDVLRAWLSRDQECRLADILSWRSSKTQTRSCAQTLGEMAKLTMVRLVFGALDLDEQKAAAREKELTNAADEERKLQAYYERRYKEKLEAIRKVLNASSDVGLDDTIDQKGLISLAEAALADAMRSELPKPPDVKEIFDKLAETNKRRSEFVETKQKHLYEAERKRSEAIQLRSEADIGEIDITQGGIRVCSICRVPVDKVLAEGCGISLEPCDLSKIRADIANKRSRATTLDQEESTAETEAKRIDAQIGQINNELQSLNQRACKVYCVNGFSGVRISA